MLYRKELLTERLEKSSLFNTYFGDLKIGFMDIETTGLSPDRCKFILGGLVTINSLSPIEGDSEHFEANLTCEEFFSEFNTNEDEKAALEAYIEALSQLDVMVSYNGARFDVPFLEARCKVHKIHITNVLPFNLDFYKVVNHHSTLRKILPNLKQKTVEAYCGLAPTRTDAISGAESVDLYYAYLAHKPGEGKDAIRETVILHNSDDCLQLFRLLPVIKKTDFHKAMSNIGFPCKGFHINGIFYKTNCLLVQGKQHKQSIDYFKYSDPDSPYTIKLDGNSKDLELKFELLEVPAQDGIPALSLLDAKLFDVDLTDLKNLPGFENDYIIVKKGGNFNHQTVNYFVKLLLTEISRRFN